MVNELNLGFLVKYLFESMVSGLDVVNKYRIQNVMFPKKTCLYNMHESMSG